MDAIGYLDDDLIEEAESVRFRTVEQPRRIYSRPMRIAALTASAAVLIFGAFLFPRFFLRMGSTETAPASAQYEAATEEGLLQAETTAEEPADALLMTSSDSAPAAEEDKAPALAAGPADNGTAASALTWAKAEDTVTFQGRTYRPMTEEEMAGWLEEGLVIPPETEPAGVTEDASASELADASVFIPEEADSSRILVEIQGEGIYGFVVQK